MCVGGWGGVGGVGGEGANILMKIYMQWLAAEILMGCLKSTHMSIIMSPVWLATGVGRGGGCQFLAVLM